MAEDDQIQHASEDELALAAATVAYRDAYRVDFAGAGYNGWRHGVLVLGVGVAMIAGLLYWAPRASFGQWAGVVAATLLIANFVEYFTHRGPMHHPTRLLRPMFERHAQRHHRYFSRNLMAVSAPHDLHAVLFPPVLFLFFAAIALGLSLLVAVLLSVSAAFGFAISCLFYYLCYEVLHLFYHLRGAERVPIFGYLARLHRIHHNSSRQPLCNFNLVFPLCDWIFATLNDHAGDAPVKQRH